MDFGLSKEVLSQIRNIVNENKKYKFKIFGSRVKHTYKKTSDIDIAIMQKGDVTLKLKRELDELRCIYTFDVVDMNLIGEKLKENIEKDKICIYKK